MVSVIDFIGKVVIVTGSSSGIGEGTAILFAKLGAHVVVTGLNADDVHRVANTCLSVSPKNSKPLEITADITNDIDANNLIQSTVNEFGRIDVLVNNAGAACVTDIFDDNYIDVYDYAMQLNIRAAVYLSHLAVPYLEKTKGNIVCISSVSSLKPSPGMTPYCMAKSALDMFVKCAAVELGPKGIRVNGINPGAVKSNALKALGLSDEEIELKIEGYISVTPLRVHGQPVDIANSVAFLASSEASFITGINMLVDGGYIFS